MSSGTEQVWPLVIIAGVLASFILVGLINKSREGSEYGFGGRFIGRIGSGAAIASNNWMSAASFLGIAGILYLKGYLALAYVIGWTGGSCFSSSCCRDSCAGSASTPPPNLSANVMSRRRPGSFPQ